MLVFGNLYSQSAGGVGFGVKVEPAHGYQAPAFGVFGGQAALYLREADGSLSLRFGENSDIANQPINREVARWVAGNGKIAGAGLDVFEHEPAVNPKLVRLAKAGKATLLPHMGSATIEGRVEMGEKVIINIRTFLDNHKPPDRVLPSML